MNEHGRRHREQAYLVADIDFRGPLPVVRQFSIFSHNPFHEPGLGPGRMWAVLMKREAGSFEKASREILADLETHRDNIIFSAILKLMDQAPDEKTHALKYRLPQALDAFVTKMSAPDHPFFRQPQDHADDAVSTLLCQTAPEL